MSNNVLPEEIIITDSKNLADSINVSIYDKVFVLVDTNTEKYCLPVLEESAVLPESRIEICVPAGEEYKSLSYCEHIWDVMIQHEASRSSCLVIVGGGVVCDMGALAASLLKRGMDYYLFPTTLLAQVDASVGGKAAVNYKGYKNQIGCFSSPKEVIINPDFLKTLPQRHLNSGFFEMLKHGIISDDNHFADLLAVKPINANTISPFIWPSLQLKIAVVQDDPYEHNLRKALNFGHTIGHALEAFSLKNNSENYLLHGEAVALGMIAEMFIAEKIFDISNNIREKLQAKTATMFEWKFSTDHIPEILRFIAQDKKNRNGIVMMSLPVNDEIALNVAVEERLITESMEYLLKWLNK